MRAGAAAWDHPESSIQPFQRSSSCPAAGEFGEVGGDRGQAEHVRTALPGRFGLVEHAGQRAVSPGLPVGFPDETAIRKPTADGTNRAADVTVGGREYVVHTQPRGDGVVQAIMDLRSSHADRDRLLKALLISGGVGLVLAGAVGAWLARRAVSPLLQALAVQRRFVADASHELRTPLTLLSTRAQLLRRRLKQGTDPGSTESDVDGLVDDAARLTTILEDLLPAADPREEVPQQWVDLRLLVKQAVDAAQPAALKGGVRLTVEGGADPIHPDGFESGLRRAVTALLDNGIRHARAAVRTVVDVENGQARVDVEDDGPGIDPASVSRWSARSPPDTAARSPHTPAGTVGPPCGCCCPWTASNSSARTHLVGRGPVCPQ
jgi:hypothetical protein